MGKLGFGGRPLTKEVLGYGGVIHEVPINAEVGDIGFGGRRLTKEVLSYGGVIRKAPIDREIE